MRHDWRKGSAVGASRQMPERMGGDRGNDNKHQ